MAKLAMLFPGQGAQTIGMGKDFYDHSQASRNIFDQASERSGLDLKKLCFEENTLLNQTEYTQPALTTTCVALVAELLNRGIKADMTAGLSLGEYPALYTAGVFLMDDLIDIVQKRGRYMAEAVPNGQGAMAAVLGMKAEAITAIINADPDVSIANYNCPGQIVITGKTASVQKASAELSAAGARRVIPLNVSGPFHSNLLNGASTLLATALDDVTLLPLNCDFISNVTGDYVPDAHLIKPLLAQQVCHPVRWQQSMEKMLADGVDTFIEIGPGRTLSGFMRKINRKANVITISHWDDLEKIQ